MVGVGIDLKQDESKVAVNTAELNHILDKTISFINNCDNKVSILLGIYGIFLTILFTSYGFLNVVAIIKSAIASKLGKLFIACMVFFLVLACYGIVRLIMALTAKTDSPIEIKDETIELDSNIYFEHIIKNKSYYSYKQKIIQCSLEDYKNDLISQIYLNSKICSRKYRHYKYGMLSSFVGIFAFMFLWGIGALIY